MAPHNRQMTHLDWKTISQAASIIAEGGIVAIPTETVYGLAADATNEAAVARVFAAKGRPSFNPLIAHVENADMASTHAAPCPMAKRLMSIFWPGPLTLVLPLNANATGRTIAPNVTAGLETIALRSPNHPIAQALIGAVGRPLAAPSANPSGSLSPTRAEHVKQTMAGKVDMVLDGGACKSGLESTIVKVEDNRLRILRAGVITASLLHDQTGWPVITPDQPDTKTSPSPANIEAPGMLLQHYAPRARLILDVARPAERMVWLSFGSLGGHTAHPHTLSLSPAGDLNEAAHALFAHLHQADEWVTKFDLDMIGVAPIPAEGIGIAINDRLVRAASSTGERPVNQAE